MLTLAILAFWLLISLVFSALSLGWSGRICGFPKVRLRRRFLAALIIFVINILAMAAFLRASPGSDPRVIAGAEHNVASALFWPLLSFVFQIVLSWWILFMTMRPSIGLSWLILLVWLVFQGVYAGTTVFVVKRFMVEAFVVPTNAMGPTLAGAHVRGTCPHCGQAAMLPGYTDPITGEFALAPDHLRGDTKPPALVDCICFSCLRIGKTAPTPGPSESWDRLLVNKLQRPRRWDLLVFRYPRPREGELPPIYVMRLVGLPGELVAIKQGAVWINGVKAEPPDSLQGLQYLSDAQAGPGNLPIEEALKADEENPRPAVQLSSKGYFVLGDFTTRSSDSREWGEVPEENIVGVGSVIYWPANRWRVLR